MPPRPPLAPKNFDRENSIDPLDIVLAPPPNETPEQRAIRENLEKEAAQRSHDIDTELKAAKIALKRYKNAIKILVLGQSLSGKSTTIKNFQIRYAQKAWSEERESWKAVVLLNLVRSVNIIVDALNDVGNHYNRGSVDSHSPYESHFEVVIPTERHRSVVLRLLPLKQVEKDLKAFLGAGASEVEVAQTQVTPDSQTQVLFNFKKTAIEEFSVRSSSGWRGVLEKIRDPQPGKDSQLHRVACQVVAGCKEDIKWLWRDSVTQNILHNHKIDLEGSPGFFLEDIDRVVEPEYQPSDHDIVRARLRTTGVQEYHFHLDRANGVQLDWIMYDVAGIRTSRAAWVPYFKEVTALIFLAPLSAFNERLEEDSRVYRLEDTFALWKALCANKLLSNVQLILFLNKIDLLRKKLDAGMQVNKYIPEYDKGNDFESVTAWFRRIFKRYFFQNRGEPGESAVSAQPGRVFMAHFTSVVDTVETAATLKAVQITILNSQFHDAGLI